MSIDLWFSLVLYVLEMKPIFFLRFLSYQMENFGDSLDLSYSIKYFSFNGV